MHKAWGRGKGKRFVTWADESGRRHFSKQSEIHNRPAKIEEDESRSGRSSCYCALANSVCFASQLWKLTSERH